MQSEHTDTGVIVDESAAEPEAIEVEEEEAPKPPRQAPQWLKRLLSVRIRIPAAVLRIVLLLVIGVVVLGGAFVGGVLLANRFLPARYHVGIFDKPKPGTVVARATPKPTPSPTPNPFLAVEATLHGPFDPDFDATQDPETIVRFVRRLERVNELAGIKVITKAEYHDNINGDRYYLAIASSCSDLHAYFPGDRLARIESTLESQFDTFAFVEPDSDGEWGVASCSGLAK